MDDISNHFKSIPTWDEKNINKSFTITNDKYSGRIPCTRLESWRDFTGLLEHDYFHNSKDELVFRGHRRWDWGLTPTLGRVTKNGIITTDIVNEQLDLFKKAIRGRIKDHSLLEDENELWSVGQHHGLMTPLLDWTYSPYVALFFAFLKTDIETEPENPYRAVYILNKSIISDDDLCPDIVVFEPQKDDHGRLVSQAGLFTVSPTDSTIENKLIDMINSDDFPERELLDEDNNIENNQEAFIISKYICKIYIKNDNQSSCLKNLRLMNVHHASLFPDLIGASDYCNAYLTERFNERNKTTISEDIVEDITYKSSDNVETFKVTENEDKYMTNNIKNIIYLLKSSIRDELSDSIIEIIGGEISNVLSNTKYIDWHNKQSVQAEMKNYIRVIFRRFHYPDYARTEVTNRIIMNELEMQEIKNE